MACQARKNVATQSLQTALSGPPAWADFGSLGPDSGLPRLTVIGRGLLTEDLLSLCVPVCRSGNRSFIVSACSLPVLSVGDL